MRLLTCKCALQGLEGASAAVRASLIEFMLHMAEGNTDAALKAMKAVRDPAVWQTMAAVSVRSQQLDVLELCLSNIENLAAARAVREEKARQAAHGGPPNKGAVIGAAAVHLGLEGDAANILEASKAWPQLLRLRCAQGRWDDALAVARKHHRIHLRATHCEYGRALEAQGAYDAAAEQYIDAGVAASEATRMFLQAGLLDKLEEFVAARKENDPALARWWGMYLASQGDVQSALGAFDASGDTLSEVRARQQSDMAL